MKWLLRHPRRLFFTCFVLAGSLVPLGMVVVPLGIRWLNLALFGLAAVCVLGGWVAVITMGMSMYLQIRGQSSRPRR